MSTLGIILLIIVLLIMLSLMRFSYEVTKDKHELKNNPLPTHFAVFIEYINEGFFQGSGRVVTFKDDPRSINLYCDNARNYLIQMYYSTGHLTVTLNYKYFQVEMPPYKKLFADVRNASSFQQKLMAQEFVETGLKSIKLHQMNNQFLSTGAKSNSTPKTHFGSSDGSKMHSMDYLESMYGQITREQAIAVADLFCYIVGASSFQDVVLFDAIGLHFQVFSISYEECHKSFSPETIDSIVNLLHPIMEDDHTMLAINAHSLVEQAMGISSQYGKECGDRLNKVFTLLGYSKDQIEEEVQKSKLIMDYLMKK